jgi:uncharacterized protein
MNATANETLIRDYFATVTGGDTGKSLPDFFAEDVTWHVPQSNPMIKPNPRQGFAAVMDLLTSGVEIYQPGSMQLELGHLVADDSRVAAQFTLNATLANGNNYRNQYMFLFSISAGKIDGVWEYLDTLYQQREGTFDGFV